MDIRQIVLDRLAELGWSNYRLAEVELAGRVQPSPVYRWLRGESELRSGPMGEVLAAVGLAVTPIKGWKPPVRE